MTSVRGLRNRNPGNLRHGSPWRGLAADQPDPDFCSFESMDYGCRALLVTLCTYRREHKLATVRGIIGRWAPPTENDTEAYVAAVAGALGVNADAHLPPRADVLLKLARAIARHECGRAADTAIREADWLTGAQLAGIKERWA